MASNTTTGMSFTPATPHRRKLRNSAVIVALLRRGGTHKKNYSGYTSTPVNFRKDFIKSELSARKLAAVLWQLRYVDLSYGDGDANMEDQPFLFPSSQAKDAMSKTSTPCMKSSKEEANEASNKFSKVYNRKLQKDRKLAGHHDPIVTVLLEELLLAQRSINKLKVRHKLTKKKVKQILQTLEEEKALWKCREQNKFEAVLDDMKDKLSREKRSREKMEVLNRKLGHALAIANDSAKQFMTQYEREKKERELTEEVCDELAKQIGDEKDKAEAAMSHSMKICKELEEEREMMQMIEHWRQERAQMKLEDAKHLLEDKYNEMVNLIAYLQMFLRSKGDDVDTTEIEDTQLIKEAIDSVNIKKIVELAYDFSNSDDVFPIHCDEHGEDNKESVDEEALDKNSMLHLHSTHRRSYGEGSSRDYNYMKNPHITRGMKGCIEWPRGIRKTNSNKVKIPLEEIVKSQKSQLDHILKPKAY